MAGLAASGALTSGLRLITKAAFEDFHNGLRKGTSMSILFNHSSFFLCSLFLAAQSVTDFFTGLCSSILSDICCFRVPLCCSLCCSLP